MNGKNQVRTGIGVQTIQNGYLSASTLITELLISDEEPLIEPDIVDSLVISMTTNEHRFLNVSANVI